MKEDTYGFNTTSNKRAIINGASVFVWIRPISIVAAFIFFFLTACATGSISNKHYVQKGPKFPRHNGDVTVYWKDHGVPSNPNAYKLIATVSGRTTWCGITRASFHKELHDWIKESAAQAGGNAVIIYCGELGTVSECYCYGDIIRFQ